MADHFPSPESAKSFFLWSDLDDLNWQHLANSICWEKSDAGETIVPLTERGEQCLCVLWQGKIKVYAATTDTDHAVLLRTMEAGAVFGVHAVFDHNAAPLSHLVAVRRCIVLKIPVAVWEEILRHNPSVMETYVRFLTNRVEFLNRKIRYLTAGSSERKLALYLLSVLPKDGSFARLPLPTANLADLLDLGRASLYRALNRLQQDGFLLQDGKSYALINREHLQDHYK